MLIPSTVDTLRCSSRKIIPKITAVRGWSAPRIEVSVGPMRLTAFTPVKLDIIVDQRARPRM